MKTRFLFVMFLLASTVCAVAADTGQTQSKSSPSAQQFNLFQQQPKALNRSFSLKLPSCMARLVQKAPFTINIVPGGTYSMEPSTCYTMRTYMVKREPGTDVTRPSGYQQCLPSSRVHVQELEVVPTPGRK